MREKNNVGENETTIENAITTLRKQEHAGGYSCKVCGTPIDAHAPDDVHRFSSVYPCWKFDWVERIYECIRCSKNIKLFWHPKVHKHHEYATVEEIEHKTSKDIQGNLPDYARRMRGY